jgi:hypothetical protein
VRDGHAVDGPNVAMMEITKMIEHVFPQAPKFPAVKLNAQAQCCTEFSFDFKFINRHFNEVKNVLCAYEVT